MIHYLVTAQASYTMSAYVNGWGPLPGSRMRFLYYDDLPGSRNLDPGTYIFSDLERLSTPELEMTRRVWEILSAPECHTRLINNPLNVLRRYELLSRLFEEGVNRFRAFRITEPLHTVRFPVFIREENEHNGTLTPLLHNRREMEGQLWALKLKGYRADDLLIIEFCDTSDSAGIFRKYSAFVVGDEILPRHLIFSRSWNLKKPDLVDSALSLEQKTYLETNPHRKWLSQIFEMAGIEYGRIDYSILGDEPQIWEINTNPTVRRTTPRLTSAFEASDVPKDSGGPVRFEIDPSLRRQIDLEKRSQRRARAYRMRARALYSSRWVRLLLPIAKSLVRSFSSLFSV